jgi:tripartite ATP-independent transporter DctM subunit
MISALMLALFVVAFLIGIPVSASLILAAGVAMMLVGQNLIGVPQHMAASVRGLELMAIPFFILAAHLMMQLGMIRKIFDFAEAALGWFRGGLAHANVLAGFVFSGISGAAVADAAALGSIAMKEMPKAGYSAPFAAAIVMSISTLGAIIPPSIMMVVYAIMADVSIARLFLAGIVPGIMIALSISGLIAFYGAFRLTPMPDPPPFDGRRLLRTTRSALLALFAPLVILRGMSTGLVTPTEAGVLASLYALLVGAIERTISFRAVYTALRDTVESSAHILFLIAASSAISYVFVSQGTAGTISAAFGNSSLDVVTFLLLSTLVLLAIGCIIETLPALLISVPLMLPTATALGIDPVHFGVLAIFNLLIGIMTPPMGIGLFILSSVSGIRFGSLAWTALPFVALLIGMLMLLSFVPQFTLWLPDLLLPVPA